MNFIIYFKKNLLAADPFGHQLLFNKSICLLPAVKYCGEYKCTGGGLKLELNLGNREKLDKMNFCYKVASFAFKSRCNETFSKFKKKKRRDLTHRCYLVSLERRKKIFLRRRITINFVI